MKTHLYTMIENLAENYIESYYRQDRKEYSEWQDRDVFFPALTAIEAKAMRLILTDRLVHLLPTLAEEALGSVPEKDNEPEEWECRPACSNSL